jgi:hypothetical protein
LSITLIENLSTHLVDLLKSLGVTLGVAYACKASNGQLQAGITMESTNADGQGLTVTLKKDHIHILLTCYDRACFKMCAAQNCVGAGKQTHVHILFPNQNAQESILLPTMQNRW